KNGAPAGYVHFSPPPGSSYARTLPSVAVQTARAPLTATEETTPPAIGLRQAIEPSAILTATISPAAPGICLGSKRMLLQATRARSPANVGPPQGLSASGAFQRVFPSPASRHWRARSPVFSSSRKADATKTLPCATARHASTCHSLRPFC